MADDKSKHGARDRATVSGSETYELAHFAERNGISQQEARALVDRVGNSRTALDAAIAGTSKPAPKTKSPRTSATTPRDRVGKAPSAEATATTPKRTSAAKTPARASALTSAPRKTTSKKLAGKVADAAAPVTAAVDGAVAAVVQPVAKAAAPVKRRAAKAGRTVATAARRGTASVRANAASAPKTIRNRASAALDTAKSAVTGRAASVVGAAAAGLVTGLAVNLGRKLIVQAPSALAGDWLDALKVEHKLALALFDQLQATGTDDTGQRSALLTQLKHALGKHAFTEENVIYPALRTWGDTADADKLNHDHGYVKQYLYDLEEMDNASPAFLEKVAAFRTELKAHIREEEEAIFPPLHAGLGDAGNAKVTAQANKEGFKLA